MLLAHKIVVVCSAMTLCALLPPAAIDAAQVDIHGPLGSVAFGTYVAVLPNGNLVVADPNGPVSNVGVVYLLTGSNANDHVGSGGIALVGEGNFVVASPQWNNGSHAAAGAATWVDGTTGLSGVVSVGNSLVGTATNDRVGYRITVLSNGNFLVGSPYWNGGFGAATWVNASTGLSGTVSMNNSLVGTATTDFIGIGLHDITALSNGNYVVGSPRWNNFAGAATWANGTTGVSGAVSASNSLVGTTLNDYVGFTITALSNGNYVVASPNWQNYIGAVTWANGATGASGRMRGRPSSTSRFATSPRMPWPSSLFLTRAAAR